jgi:hypothetical protein
MKTRQISYGDQKVWEVSGTPGRVKKEYDTYEVAKVPDDSGNLAIISCGTLDA